MAASPHAGLTQWPFRSHGLAEASLSPAGEGRLGGRVPTPFAGAGAGPMMGRVSVLIEGRGKCVVSCSSSGHPHPELFLLHTQTGTHMHTHTGARTHILATLASPASSHPLTEEEGLMDVARAEYGCQSSRPPTLLWSLRSWVVGGCCALGRGFGPSPPNSACLDPGMAGTACIGFLGASCRKAANRCCSP